MNLIGKTVLICGGTGLLGRHLSAALSERGASAIALGSEKYDLTKPSHAVMLVNDYRPDVVIHAAARVGGILANKQNPYLFGRDNLLMGLNVIDACAYRVEKLVFIGTTCSYPSECEVPFHEEDLWFGPSESTNASYGHAKRLLGDLLAAAVYEGRLKCGTTAVLANLYGPGDNFDPESSHVIPAIIRKMCESTDEVELWGNGLSTRDFLYVKDAAEGICRVCEDYDDPSPINLGTGVEYSIEWVARMIAEIVGFKGQIAWNQNGLDGQKRRALSTRKAWELLHWDAKMPMSAGLAETVQWWRGNRE